VWGALGTHWLESSDLPGHPLHFAREMRPAYRAREPACLLAFIAVIRLLSSWPGRIPRPLLFSVAPEKSGEKVPRTRGVEPPTFGRLKPKVRATTPRARGPAVAEPRASVGGW
jgi:hypothetical protein